MHADLHLLYTACTGRISDVLKSSLVCVSAAKGFVDVGTFPNVHRLVKVFWYQVMTHMRRLETNIVVMNRKTGFVMRKVNWSFVLIVF